MFTQSGMVGDDGDGDGDGDGSSSMSLIGIVSTVSLKTAQTHSMKVWIRSNPSKDTTWFKTGEPKVLHETQVSMGFVDGGDGDGDGDGDDNAIHTGNLEPAQKPQFVAWNVHPEWEYPN